LNGASPLDEAEKYNGQDSAIYRYFLAMGALILEVRTLLRGGNTARHEQTLPNKLEGKGRMDELKQLLELEGPSVVEGATPSYYDNQNQRSFENA
jgi:hypothetical protein